ncbi:MalY/PatB family protein [uncultured Bacteroides sp.]|uniref:MalY/PatB family protein n=1 Tax=uncultured Bacteroides sp. TaxID=162156 RepID=UPI002597526E|nr:MalY/PatB family protein [uncultured Bacteroides sp.]
MKYDFDKQISRRGTDSYKWDSAESEHVLPMWVADMDFPTAPAIVDALKKRIEHGIFGYTRVPESYYKVVTDWFSRRHNWTVNREWIIYTSGVVPAVSAIIKALTVPGDKVLVQTPVYNCFFSSIRNNGCEMVSSPLCYADNTYTIDYADLECKAADPKVKIMLLCNPHNPAGRVWKREELVRIGAICIRHGVTVVSDEIHCELVFPGHCYTPFASISEDFLRHSVTCLSPSKAFNIAGLQIANIVCADANRRSKIDRAINDNEVCDVNPFGVIATQAAYKKKEKWLDQLIEYLHANYLYMREFCREHLPEFPVTVLEGTYLVWMDCRKLGLPSEELERQLMEQGDLWLNAGIMYGMEGEGFMRWNIACPRTTLIDGLTRFSNFIHR